MAADLVNPPPECESLSVHVRVELSSLTLEVAGEFRMEGVTAIFGASGSGKTTLLRAIAGFETPTRGHVRAGEAVWFDRNAGIDLPPHERPVGLLFQDGRLFPHLDVAGNIDFGLRRRGAREDAAPIDRREVIETLGLAELLPRSVAALSGGERQRVALARTLLSRPRLLLLDEPFSGIDADRKSEILPYLERVARRFDLPTLLVSHDIDEVARLADHVWVLSEGQVQTEGPVAQIVERLDLQPLTGRFEAGVLIEGRVSRHDPRLHLSFLDLGGDELAMPIVEDLEVGALVRLRVRARDVAIATRRPEGLSIRNVLPGTLVDLVREEGTGVVLARIDLAGSHLRARLTLAAVEALELAPGDAVYALIKSVSFDRRGM